MKLYHAVSLTFDLLQGQFFCWLGEGGRINYCPPPFVKVGDIKTHSSVRTSVTKTLTWLISSELFMLGH